MRVLGIIGLFLWTLLKILLLILLAVLVLLVIILCFSICYEATGRAEGENFGEGLEAHAKITALLGLVNLRGILRGGDLLYSFRIAGKTIKKGRRRKGDAGGQEEYPEQEEASEPGGSPGIEKVSEEEGNPEFADFSEWEEASGSEESSGAEEFSGSGKRPGKHRGAGKKKKRNRGKVPEDVKTPGGAHSASDGKSGPEEGFQSEEKTESEEKTGPDGKSLSEKIASGWEKAESAWEKLQEPSFGKTLSRVKSALGKVLRHILPQDLRGRAVAGTGDPALTGQLIGLFYACWPLYGENWDLELSGDFEKKRLQGKVYMKGRIRPITVIGIALGLLLDKNILRLIWSRLKRKKG